MLPPTEYVAVRLPDGEVSPTPQDCEAVVINEHFAHGFGLPARNFFSRFLGLKLHHLTANAILLVAAFVRLCEEFLGIEPRLDLWRHLFFFKQQLVPDGTSDNMKRTACGAALVHHQTNSGFPKVPL
ncbi:hypothetical protein D1007_46999 [Hordeum vulgare]|nr:hypothetical protein D1007_46999 [Hordeum vulgare]